MKYTAKMECDQHSKSRQEFT